MFFDKDNGQNTDLTKVSALLIHAAKIDENYSNKEEEIIKQTIIKLGANSNDLKRIMEDGKKN